MNVELIEYLLRLVLALVVGGTIGMEREIKGKPAGMRTNMLMCMGTCLLMILSIEVLRHNGKMGDPTRIASQVMTGIGFLGAGSIIQSRFSVTGLTSAATLWFVAAIGLVIGWGNYVLAVAAALLIILTLTTLSRMERMLAIRQRHHFLQFQFPASSPGIKRVRQILIDHRIRPEDIGLRRLERQVIVDVEYIASDREHERVVDAVSLAEGVEILLEY
jgi:putative Mg2+ transporter-C (MgtC) family protein